MAGWTPDEENNEHREANVPPLAAPAPPADVVPPLAAPPAALVQQAADHLAVLDDAAPEDIAAVVVYPVFRTEFTTSGVGAFDRCVRQYAQRLEAESKNIESMEHVGDGPPEITGAHVEEAKWVLVRRMRLRNLSTRGIVACRIVQAASSLIVGIGTSNLGTQWGPILSLVSLAVGFAALMIETEISREY